jgi:hypothetical protein
MSYRHGSLVTGTCGLCQARSSQMEREWQVALRSPHCKSPGCLASLSRTASISRHASIMRRRGDASGSGPHVTLFGIPGYEPDLRPSQRRCQQRPDVNHLSVTKARDAPAHQGNSRRLRDLWRRAAILRAHAHNFFHASGRTSSVSTSYSLTLVLRRTQVSP